MKERGHFDVDNWAFVGVEAVLEVRTLQCGNSGSLTNPPQLSKSEESSNNQWNNARRVHPTSLYPAFGKKFKIDRKSGLRLVTSEARNTCMQQLLL